MDAQMQTVQNSLQTTLDKATQLQALLQKLNNIKADKLEQETNSSQYLDMLASVMYCLNALTHSYAHLKSQTVPEQFNSVKIYYQKIRDALQNKQPDAPTAKINKQVAGRLIKRGL